MRVATIDDLAFVIEAQRASVYELEPQSDYDIYEALRCGEFLCIILLVDCVYRALVCATVEGKSAMVSCLYRVGPTQEAHGDFGVLFGVLREELQARAVKHVYCCISEANPLKAKIERHHKRLGFKQDMIRMSMEI